MSTTITCTCYCGRVHLEVNGDTTVCCGICVCDSCKRAHATLLYSVIYLPQENVKILRGEELLKFIWKNDQAAADARQKGRAFCTQCGSSMLIKAPCERLSSCIGIFHGTFDDPSKVNEEPWNPFGPNADYYCPEEQHCSFLASALDTLTMKWKPNTPSAEP